MPQDLPMIARARQHREAVAIRCGEDESTYGDLLDRSASIASALLGDADDLAEAHVGFMAPAGFGYVAAQWGVWRAGGVAVPLCLSAAEPELAYAMTDAKVQCVVAARSCAEKIEGLCARLNLPLEIIEDISGTSKTLPGIDTQRRAMILYTSGTTSKPKGVVTTHANITSQIETLVRAWAWEPADRIPLFLPMHHIHGIINVMSCALWSGAQVEAFPGFEMGTILERVSAGAYTVFMAVPTIYVKLIEALEAAPPDQRSHVVAGFGGMRLMISGSAALPASVHEKWTSLTGQALLERYGMTELGMALSNPYHGQRRPGMVGQALPGVQVRLKSEAGEIITTQENEPGEPGEIQVRGPGVFLEYWGRPDITAESFDGGWFRTGDMATLEDGYFRIMGRLSVDIIKSGGYKLSALEIEAALLEHPAIRECAVVGVADDVWGEAVAVAAVLSEGEPLGIKELRAWCGDRLSKYKMPKRLLAVESLPRNAMGKVTKRAVQVLFQP